MKRLRMLTMLLLFSLSAVLLSGSVQAKPKLDGKPVAWAMYVVDELDYDDDDLDIERARPVLELSGGVWIKNVSKKAKFTNIKCTDKRFGSTNTYYDKTSKRWYVSLYADNAKKGSTKDFTISFDVKDGSKKVHMKTRCKFHKWNFPFKKLKIGGVDVLPYVKKGTNYSEVPLAGKKASFSYKLKKGYSIADPIIYGSKTKLRAGDVIEIDYGSKKDPKRLWVILVK